MIKNNAKSIGVMVSSSNSQIYQIVANALLCSGFVNVCRLEYKEKPKLRNTFLIKLICLLDKILSNFLNGSKIPVATVSPNANSKLTLEEFFVNPFINGKRIDSVLMINDVEHNADLFKKIGINNIYKLHIGLNDIYKSFKPGFVECIKGATATKIYLERLESEYETVRIAEMTVQVHIASIAHTYANLMASLEIFIVRAGKKIRGNDDSVITDNSYSKEIDLHSIEVQHLAKHFFRLVHATYDRFAHRFQWFLAVMPRENDEVLVQLNEIKPILPPSDRFWADPFLVTHEGVDWVFFEEAMFKSEKGSGVGHICVAPIDSSGFIGPIQRVLDRPWHLSYPNVFEYNGDWYMIPESGSQKCIELYKCLKWPDRWELHSTLLENYEGYDATIAKTGDTYFMFVARRAKGSCTADFLDLFYAHSPLGPWKISPSSPIVMDVQSARPGGRLFEYNGDLYRPCQDSSGGIYGRKLRLQKIKNIELQGYSEYTQLCFEPNQVDGIVGIHTIAMTSNFVVVDLCRKISRFSFVNRLSNRLPKNFANANFDFFK